MLLQVMHVHPDVDVWNERSAREAFKLLRSTNVSTDPMITSQDRSAGRLERHDP